MQERFARTDAGTIAWVFRTSRAAEEGAQRLRAAGFSDARVSENAGTTRDEHVPASAGLTSADFERRLCDAGFHARDARDVTDAVRAGGVLLTLAAGARAERAFAVLRGEAVPPETVFAVDAAPADRAALGAEPASGETSLARDAAFDSEVDGDAARTLELREERLAVGTRRDEREARIRKEVVTEERTITVPVRREELVVERDGERDVRIPLSDADRDP